ncbi:hypothetical protein AWC23_02860 [Mycobacterium saskatchewanense]|uniref:Class I SAM-dependent methyltransferase n=1 Tax=Mycobacterium saskatchewanense TaxID=220927 RepID=A0AAJ3NU86_9MYCO|nr:hypothetical protein AWC23_02860 [Mycobacterium saskatchewanense]
MLFDAVLTMQIDNGVGGDLLEIGALYGKSAIVLGCRARPDEQVIVCDVFDEAAGEDTNVAENDESYSGLNREKFEEIYSRWVDRPPVVIAELSEHIVGRIAPGSLRFAHIDGSHLYGIVRMDIANTRTLLKDTGVVVMDDFRALHTPGVAAAVWEAVANDGLIPVCLSEQKFYGAWNADAAQVLREALTDWVIGHGDQLNCGVQEIAGASVLIIENPLPLTLQRRMQLLLPASFRDRRGKACRRPYLGVPPVPAR